MGHLHGEIRVGCVLVCRTEWLRGDLCIRHKRKLSVWLLPMPPHPAWPKSLREPHNISGDKTPPLSSFNHVGVAPPDLGAQTVKALSCGPFGVGTTGQTIRGWDVHRRGVSLRDSLVIPPESGSDCHCSVPEGHGGGAQTSPGLQSGPCWSMAKQGWRVSSICFERSIWLVTALRIMGGAMPASVYRCSFGVFLR